MSKASKVLSGKMCFLYKIMYISFSIGVARFVKQIFTASDPRCALKSPITTDILYFRTPLLRLLAGCNALQLCCSPKQASNRQ